MIMSQITCTEFKTIRKVYKVDGAGFNGILLYNWQMYLLFYLPAWAFHLSFKRSFFFTGVYEVQELLLKNLD